MTACLPTLHRFAEDLNSTQYAAVTYSGGPLLVTAGPGTGKTRVLTYRVAWLLDHGVSASEILMLTFSNSAAEEMLTRAVKLAVRSAKLFGGTFHSVGCRFLRQYGHHIGLPRFSILDRDDAEGIIAQLRHSSGSAKGLPGKAEILNFISAAANTLRSVEELGASAFIFDIAKDYAAYKRQHALLDFDDLLTCWLGLLVESETAREKITAQFQHVLVDEYQDTNPVQEPILRLLAPHGNITAVGDDAQSVYAFRGVDSGCLRRFQEDFAAAEVTLRHNYRSLPPLIAFSNAVMPGKNLYSDKPGGLLPLFHPAADESDEAAFVAARIQQLLADGVPASEIAVLFRSARHADRLDLELTALGIPFDRRGGFKASKSAHVKDALAFFRILIDPKDRLAWTRIFLQLDNVGEVTAAALTETALSADPLAALASFETKPKWHDGFNILLSLLRSIWGGKKPDQVAADVINYILPFYARRHPDNFAKRQHGLDRLAEMLASHSDLQNLVDDLACFSDDTPAGDRISLFTMHAAKCREWKAVFIIGLAQGLFPDARVSPAQMEEERRLFYVASTRAREQLSDLAPQDHHGRPPHCHRAPSVFLQGKSGLLRTETVPF
ncbi:MAG: ATP-dependent helicase [Candidatus Electronema sp. VV]